MAIARSARQYLDETLKPLTHTRSRRGCAVRPRYAVRRASVTASPRASGARRSIGPGQASAGRAPGQPAPHPTQNVDAMMRLDAAVLPPDGGEGARLHDAVRAHRAGRRRLDDAHRRRALRRSARASGRCGSRVRTRATYYLAIHRGDASPVLGSAHAVGFGSPGGAGSSSLSRRSSASSLDGRSSTASRFTSAGGGVPARRRDQAREQTGAVVEGRRPELGLRDVARCLPEDRSQSARGERAVERHGERLPLATGQNASKLGVATPYRYDLEPEHPERAQDVPCGERPKGGRHARQSWSRA